MTRGRFSEVTGALLLGGASRRMGRDKAALPVDGSPLALRLASRLQDLFEEVLLVGGDPPGGTPGRRVADPAGPRSALRGLVGALEAARTPKVLVVATDLPGVDAPLLLALLAYPEADAVVPRTSAGREPLCALYRRDAVLGPARAQLEAGRLALRDLLEGLSVRELAGPDLAAIDPGGRALVNLNTPDDLRAYRAAVPESAGA